MAAPRHWDQDKDSTLYIGNLDERSTDSLVWELMLQCGPVINVHLPKDRVTQNHQGYGFVEFGSEVDADYAAQIMNQIRLWGKPIRVNKASADRGGRGPGGAPGTDGGGQGVGAELFVGNLDGMVDEKVLFETFSRFGPLIAPPKVARDDANLSKGYGFISYASFEASDDAIANMHGQYLMNKEVTVQFAYKKDGKGERHGDPAERALAAQAKKHGVSVAIPAMPASLVMPSGTPSGPAAMMNGFPGHLPGVAPPVRTPQPPPAYAGGYGGYAPPPGAMQGGYNAMPPPPHAQPNGMQSRASYNHSPLAAAPAGAGLPSRPPPSAVYGGPTTALGMGAAPPGLPPGMPPPGFQPQQMGMPGIPPQGFQPPPGFQPPHVWQ